MGVELNFINDEKDKIAPGRLIGSVFTLMFVLCAGVLWIQWNGAQDAALGAALIEDADLQVAISNDPHGRTMADAKLFADDMEWVTAGARDHAGYYAAVSGAIADSGADVFIAGWSSLSETGSLQYILSFADVGVIPAVTVPLEEEGLVEGDELPSETADGRFIIEVNVPLDGIGLTLDDAVAPDASDEPVQDGEVVE